MTLSQVEKITCPNCNVEGETEIFSSINTELDKDMKEKIISGKAFIYKCPNCQKESLLNYGVLYHDVDNKLMVQLATDENELKNAQEMFKSVTENKIQGISSIAKTLEGYKKRIVISQEALAEKIFIFEEGYDDRIMEIVKVIYLRMFFENNPDLELDGAYFVNDQGQKLVAFITTDKESFAVDFDENLYRKMEKKLSGLDLGETYLIDVNYGLEVFDTLMEMEK